MKSIIMCYQNATADYILDIVRRLKSDNIQIAPMSMLRDFTINHGYIRTSDYNIFTAKHAAKCVNEFNYDRVYLTHDIQYINKYVWAPSFIRSENNYVIRTCKLCKYRIDDTQVSKIICTKADKEIIHLQQDGFPAWCPLTDVWGLTHDEFINKNGTNIMNVSKTECSRCGALVDRLELKSYLIKSTGEQFAICRKCINNESNIC